MTRIINTVVAASTNIADHFSISTHNGEITVHNTRTGGHRTFMVKTARRGGLKGKRILSVLVNGSDYEGFAFVGDNGQINVWRRFRGGIHEQYAKLLSSPEKGQRSGLHYRYAGTCRCCNRTLTNPDSIISGIGPVCRARENERVVVAG